MWWALEVRVGWKYGESPGGPRFVKKSNCLELDRVALTLLHRGQISGEARQYVNFVRCHTLPTTSNTSVLFTLGCELHQRPRVDLALNVFE